MQSIGGEFVGVVGIDFVVSSLRSVLAKIKTRETGEIFVFHIQTRKVPYVCLQCVLMCVLTCVLIGVKLSRRLRQARPCFFDMEMRSIMCVGNRRIYALMHCVRTYF